MGDGNENETTYGASRGSKNLTNREGRAIYEMLLKKVKMEN